MLHSVVGTVVSKISKDHSSFLFMVGQSGASHPVTQYYPRRHDSYAARSSSILYNEYFHFWFWYLI